MIRKQAIDDNIRQGIASYIDYLNNIRLTDLINSIETILLTQTDKLSDLTFKTANALSNLELAKMEIDNIINTNRGGNTGIHGFISEVTETGIRNARDTFNGLHKSVILLNNNGPADILLQGKEVQMKFYANVVEEINQASNYGNMKMMFPKDHVEVIKKIMDGAKTVELSGNILTNTQINNIKKAIEDESALRGVSYDKWLEPSILKYKDVQKGTIQDTLESEVKNINKQSEQRKTDIEKQANNDRLNAKQQSQATLGEATKVAGIGAAVQGGLNLALFIHSKHKEGKEVWEFEADDWIASGIDMAKGAIKGGVSGYAIYGLTNVCHLAAPSAGAITSGTFGLSNAIIKYRSGVVDTDGFIELITLNAIDATGTAIGAAIGQTIIPIPIVGALVGSIVATTALSLGKGVFNKQEIEAINEYQSKINTFIDKLDKEHKSELESLLFAYNELGELQQYSFNSNINIQLKFVLSVNLAKLAGVTEDAILSNQNKIDDYFLN